MKTILILIVLCSMVIFDPFAPKAEKPENPNNDPDITLASNFLDNVIIPEKEDVGFPAYNNAKVFQTSKPGELGSPLHMVRTFSTDPPEKVIEFYQQNKPEDWKYKDFYGTYYFWGGDENSAMMAQSPSIQISGADQFKKMWPEANTIITIYYK
jgi:hypothetical protein